MTNFNKDFFDTANGLTAAGLECYINRQLLTDDSADLFMDVLLSRTDIIYLELNRKKGWLASYCYIPTRSHGSCCGIPSPDGIPDYRFMRVITLDTLKLLAKQGRNIAIEYGAKLYETYHDWKKMSICDFDSLYIKHTISE